MSVTHGVILITVTIILITTTINNIFVIIFTCMVRVCGVRHSGQITLFDLRVNELQSAMIICKRF